MYPLRPETLVSRTPRMCSTGNPRILNMDGYIGFSSF